MTAADGLAQATNQAPPARVPLITPAVPTGRWQRGVTRLAVEGAQIHAALAGRS